MLAELFRERGAYTTRYYFKLPTAAFVRMNQPPSPGWNGHGKAGFAPTYLSWIVPIYLFTFSLSPASKPHRTRRTTGRGQRKCRTTTSSNLAKQI